MTKQNNLTKSFILLSMSILSIFTFLLTFFTGNAVFATSHTVTVRKTEITSKYAFDTPNSYGEDKQMSPHPAGTSIYRLFINDKEVFCIEPGVTLGSGSDYDSKDYDGELKAKFNAIIYYSYLQTNKTDEDYARTFLSMQKTANPDFQGGPAYFDDFEEKYAELMKKVDNHYTQPSFANQLIKVESGKTIRLEDTNGTLSQSILVNDGNGIAKIDGNTLVITATAETTSASIEIKKHSDLSHDTELPPILYYSSKFQNLVEYGAVDPVVTALNVIVDPSVEDATPEIKTQATTANGQKVGYNYEKQKEIATLTGLVVGEEYKLVATQYSSTGEVLTAQERTFIAQDVEHVEVFEFTVPVKYVGDIVYGEDLYRDGKKIAVHYDLSNKEQTVTVIEPTIKTEAHIDGKKEQFVGEKTEILDTLTYTGFKNDKVIVKTWLVKHGTNEIVGEPIEQVLELNGDGKVDVKLNTVDTSTLPAGKYTIMEQLFEVVEKDSVVEKGNKISEHVDSNDENQSFTIKEKPQPTPIKDLPKEEPKNQEPPKSVLPKTGDNSSHLAFIGLTLISIGAIAIFVNRKLG